MSDPSAIMIAALAALAAAGSFGVAAALQLAGGVAAFAGIALLGKSAPRQLLEAR